MPQGPILLSAVWDIWLAEGQHSSDIFKLTQCEQSPCLVFADLYYSKVWPREGGGGELANVPISEIQLCSSLKCTWGHFLFSWKDMSSGHIFWKHINIPRRYSCPSNTCSISPRTCYNLKPMSTFTITMEEGSTDREKVGSEHSREGRMYVKGLSLPDTIQDVQLNPNFR